MDSINSTNMSKNVNKQVTLLKREKIGINFNWTNACPDTCGNFEFCEGVCVNTTYCIPQKIQWVSTFLIDSIFREKGNECIPNQTENFSFRS